jgi:hypothetical protein
MIVVLLLHEEDQVKVCLARRHAPLYTLREKNHTNTHQLRYTGVVSPEFFRKYRMYSQVPKRETEK